MERNQIPLPLYICIYEITATNVRCVIPPISLVQICPGYLMICHALKHRSRQLGGKKRCVVYTR